MITNHDVGVFLAGGAVIAVLWVWTSLGVSPDLHDCRGALAEEQRDNARHQGWLREERAKNAALLENPK